MSKMAQRQTQNQRDVNSYNKYFDMGKEQYNDEFPLNSDALGLYMERQLVIKHTESYFQARSGFRAGYIYQARIKGWNVEKGLRMAKPQPVFHVESATQRKLL